MGHMGSGILLEEGGLVDPQVIDISGPVLLHCLLLKELLGLSKPGVVQPQSCALNALRIGGKDYHLYTYPFAPTQFRCFQC